MSQPPSNLSLFNQRIAARQRRIEQRLGYHEPLTEKQIRAYMRPRSQRFWVPLAFLLIFLSFLLQSTLLILCALLVLSLGIVPEIWYHIALRGVRFQRAFSQPSARIGEEVLLRYRVENRKFLPLPWLEIEDDLPQELVMQRVTVFPSYKEGRTVFLTTMALWLYQRVTRSYHIRPQARGVWQLGSAYLRAGDPFGFLQNEVQIEQLDGQNSLLVYPLVVPLTRFGLPSRHPFGDRRAPRQLIEDPSQIVGIRDYAPGDALRRVHWKATAKMGTLQSKVYPQTTTYTLALFLDTNTTPNPVAGAEPALLELGIAAAASVATWAMEQRYAIGVFSNGLPSGGGAVASLEDARALMRIPPSNQPGQLPRILALLARLQPYFGTWMERVLAREATRLPPGSTIVYITAAAAIKPETLRRLEQLKRHGHDVTILLTGDQAVEASSLTIYRLGGAEEWHALSQFTPGRSDPGADAGHRPERDRQLTPGNGGESGHHSQDPVNHEPSFALG